MAIVYKQKISLYKLMQTTLYSKYFNLWLKGIFYLDSCRTVGFDNTNLISYDYYLSNYDSNLFVFVPYNPFNEAKPDGHVFSISDYASRVFDIEYSDTTGVVAYDGISYVIVADDLEFYTPVTDPVTDPSPDPVIESGVLVLYCLIYDYVPAVDNKCKYYVHRSDSSIYDIHYRDMTKEDLYNYLINNPLSWSLDVNYALQIKTDCCIEVCCNNQKYTENHFRT